jgi:hypothetical protein
MFCSGRDVTVGVFPDFALKTIPVSAGLERIHPAEYIGDFRRRMPVNVGVSAKQFSRLRQR